MSANLLSQIAGGSQTAVDEFLGRYGSMVWGLARRACRTPQDAEDATQDIFLAIWRSAERFDPAAGSETTFVLTIARRRLIDRTRRQGRRPTLEALPEAGVAQPAGLDRVEIDDEVQRAQRALEQLRPEQRQVLELALAEGRTHQEISSAIGIPLGTVKSHARRGLQRLRALLEGEGADANKGGDDGR